MKLIINSCCGSTKHRLINMCLLLYMFCLDFMLKETTRNSIIPLTPLNASHHAVEIRRGCWTGLVWDYSGHRCLLHPECNCLLQGLPLLLLLAQPPCSGPVQSPPDRHSSGSETSCWQPSGTCVCGHTVHRRRGWWERHGWCHEGCWLLPNDYLGWNTCPGPEGEKNRYRGQETEGGESQRMREGMCSGDERWNHSQSPFCLSEARYSTVPQTYM